MPKIYTTVSLHSTIYRMQDVTRELEFHLHHQICRGGFYSAQGDYSEYRPQKLSGTLIKDICRDDESMNQSPEFSSEKISLDTPSAQSDDQSFNDLFTTPNCNYNVQESNNDHSNDMSNDLSNDMSNDMSNDSSSNDSSISSSNHSSLSLTMDTHEIDKQIKTKSKFNTKKRSKRHKCMEFDLDSVDSLESLDSGESLLRHIRFCQECKDKVMQLIRKQKTCAIKSLKKHRKNSKCINGLLSELSEEDNHDNDSHYQSHNSSVAKIPRSVSNKQNTGAYNDNKSTDNTTDISSYIPELKEVLILCLIGFLVVILLDLMLKK